MADDADTSLVPSTGVTERILFQETDAGFKNVNAKLEIPLGLDISKGDFFAFRHPMKQKKIKNIWINFIIRIFEIQDYILIFICQFE